MKNTPVSNSKIQHQKSKLKTFSSIASSIPQQLQDSFMNKNNQSEDIFFTKKMMTIDEYHNRIQHSQQDLKHLQYKLDKQFYKQQLKATLYLNYCLVRLCNSQQNQLSKLRQQITFSSNQMRESIKKDDFNYYAETQEKDKQNIDINIQRFNQSLGINANQFKTYKQNLQEQEPIRIKRATQVIEEQFDEKEEEYLKIIRYNQELLNSRNQENSYLRGQLLKITQKISLICQRNREGKYYSDKSFQANSSDFKIKNNSFRLNIMSCSPINNKQEKSDQKYLTNHVQEDNQNQSNQGQISFSNDFMTEREKEADAKLQKITEQLESLREELLCLNEQHEKYKRENNLLKQQSQRLKVQTYKLFCKMNQDYHQLKTQLQQRLQDIEKYQKLLMELKNISRISRNYKEQKAKWNEQIKSCLLQKSDISSRYDQLKSLFDLKEKSESQLRWKFDRIVKFMVNQSNEWKDLFEEINCKRE